MKPSEAEIARLKASRDRLATKIAELDREIGQKASAAIAADSSVTKSSLGRALGMSHTHVGNLISAASGTTAAGTPEVSGIPVLENYLAAEVVREAGSTIERCITGYSEGDVLFQSGLDPRLLADGTEGERVRPPAMLWQLDTGQWLGVSDVTVGYVGTGPGYAARTLVEAGVDQDVARRLVRWRFCDARGLTGTEADDWTTSMRSPFHARHLPRLIDDRIIVDFGEALYRRRRWMSSLPPLDANGDEIDPADGDSSGPRRLGNFGAWLQFLDSPEAPDWATGKRVARVFLSRDAAAEQGFVHELWDAMQRLESIPTVVIEQGKVQLWGHFYSPLARTDLLAPEAYVALAEARVFPQGLADRDRGSSKPLSRLITRLFGTDNLPQSIDVSDDGASTLTFQPQLEQ